MSDRLAEELRLLEQLPLYLTYAQVEENFGISENTQRRFVREGKLDLRMLGERLPRITRVSLRRLILELAGEDDDQVQEASP